MTKSYDLQKAYVLFYKPQKFDRDWLESDLWHSAKKIIGIELLDDEDGNTARLFGVGTSGHVVVYDPQGNLKFSGGITPGRAHEGDSNAKLALLDYLHNKTNKCTYSHAFGCTLFHDGETTLFDIN